jgi:hypothetical protein
VCAHFDDATLAGWLVGCLVEGGASREARAVAFTASYVYDPWWIERHPQDTQRVCLRAFDGSFLATCGKSSYGAPAAPHCHFGGN